MCYSCNRCNRCGKFDGVDNTRYEFRVCSKCGKPLSKSETVCGRCGEPNPIPDPPVSQDDKVVERIQPHEIGDE